VDQPGITASEILPRTFWQTALLCSSIIGSILFSVVYFCFGLIEPNYYVLRQPIGDLLLLPYGWIQSANYIIFGLFIGAFAVGVRKEMGSGFGVNLIPLFHLLTALGLILCGIFIHEPNHTFANLLSFVSVLISFLLFAYRFTGDLRWKGWTTFTLFSTILMILLSVVFIYTKGRNGAYAGVFERMVIITRLVWSFIFIMRLLDGRRLAPLSSQ
jgi:hypothetical protein